MNGPKTEKVEEDDFYYVLELCCFEWSQNKIGIATGIILVLELCCFEWSQNKIGIATGIILVLELCCFEWSQNLMWKCEFIR
ncbi:TPA: hypothetical protein ACNZ3V_001603, partial [Streptococcus pyogenes]